MLVCPNQQCPLSHPDSRSDPNGRFERIRGARLYTGTLIDLFFLRAELVPVGIQTISVITKIIYIYKITTIGVVSIKNLYTYTESYLILQTLIHINV